jgi:hypothetical protein
VRGLGAGRATHQEIPPKSRVRIPPSQFVAVHGAGRHREQATAVGTRSKREGAVRAAACWFARARSAGATTAGGRSCARWRVAGNRGVGVCCYGVREDTPAQQVNTILHVVERATKSSPFHVAVSKESGSIAVWCVVRWSGQGGWATWQREGMWPRSS